jgi:hypothetical protein
LLESRRIEAHETSKSELDDLRSAVAFDRCRRKRNEISYDMADVVTDTEVEEILLKARQFGQTVEGWIADHHPQWGTCGQQ